MPTILRAGPFRFFFFASDGREPPHVHVERDEKLAKFWLSPVRIQSSGGFGRNELNRIKNIVVTHEQELLESWRDYFSN
ncbi:MAG TPA: DUF4160 domain-containing protein [Candidatus Acidoferrum sp.]|nr:DUF4160 domain-containing protein [Candidatus Acidoferrum sp.]